MAISLMEAYGIELLKSNNVTIAQLEQQFSTGALEFSIDESFDFSVLKALYDEDETQFKQAYAGNYTVKFLTFNGLRNMLRMRFQIPFEAYETLEAGNGIKGVPATEEVEQRIRQFVSSNWKVERQGDTLTLYV